MGARDIRKGSRRAEWEKNKKINKVAKQNRLDRAEKHEALLEKQAADKAARIAKPVVISTTTTTTTA